MLTYFRADERPSWEATVTVNGTAENMTSGFTFVCKLATVQAPTTAVLTKTSGITGGASGLVSVTWSGTDLDLTPGDYIAQLKASRTSDSAEWTVAESVRILARL